MTERHLFTFEGWWYFFAWCFFVALALGASLGVCIWASIEYPDWNPGWGIFGVAFVGVWIAAFGIIRVRFTARQRETLKFMNDYNNDPMVSEGFNVIYQVKEGDLPIEGALDRAKNNGEHRKNFLAVVNRFEVLAIGLDHQIYDRGMINRCFGRDIAKIYRSSERLIAYVRDKEEDPDAFKEFQKLAEKIEESQQQ